MFKKLLVFAITSGIAAKLYKSYASKQRGSGTSVSDRTTVGGSPRAGV